MLQTMSDKCTPALIMIYGCYATKIAG